MMYADASQMQARFGEQELIELTDKNGQAGELVQTVLDGALADASATIDGYLAGRYALPLASIPQVLVPICCDLARYQLYDEQAGEQVSNRHKNAMRFLELLASGKVSLGLSDEGEVQADDLPEVVSAGSVFARDKSTGFL